MVAGARDGSDTAFEALFRRYRDRITAYVRGMVSDHGRAEDIVQDVFISAHRNLLASEREIAFKPWVYEIAKNACIDQLRRARRANEVSIDSDDFSPHDEGRLSVAAASTDATVSRRQELDNLKMAFNDLPEQQHDILVMRELEGLSYETISRRTGLSRSAVESMLFRARRRLKDEFDDIATGERCLRMQGTMAKLSSRRIGMREERRLSGHLRDCATCRREAVAMGLDELAIRGVSDRARSALSRAASFLPLPAFLRRRWGESLHALQAGSPAAEQGASLATKAVALVATVALLGGGAGVARKAGVHVPIGDAGGSKAAQNGSGGPGPGAPGGGSAGGLGGRTGQPNAPGSGEGGGPGGGSAGERPARPSESKADPNGKAGTIGNSLQDPAGAVQKLGDKAGSLTNGPGGGSSGSLGSGVQDLVGGTSQTVDRVGSAVGGKTESVGGGAGDTVGSVGEKVTSLPSKTLPGPTLPGATLPDVQPTLKQVGSALPQTPPTVPNVGVPSTKLGL